MTMLVYRITNNSNGKTYVGITKNTVQDRLNTHWSASKQGSQTTLHRAMRKYGREAFTVEVLETANNRATLCDRERHFIATLKPHYNMTEGGDYLDHNKLSEDSKERMRHAKGKSNLQVSISIKARYGTPEGKQQILDALAKGRTVTAAKRLAQPPKIRPANREKQSKTLKAKQWDRDEMKRRSDLAIKAKIAKSKQISD